MADTEVIAYIKQRGKEAVAQELLASPLFKAFNSLWQTPDMLIPLAEHFGWQTLQEVNEFASSLQTAVYPWVEKYAQWHNPKPTIGLKDLTPVQWPDVQQTVVSKLAALGMTDTRFILDGDDFNLFLPTKAQLDTLMAQCPAKRVPYVANNYDCDDHTTNMQSWLAMYGLGPVTIASAAYTAYNGSAILGAHMLGLALTNDMQLWLCEPRDGKVYPISYTMLGGFFGATNIRFTRVTF